MERADRGRDTRVLKNQLYDESLEAVESDEEASFRSPPPRSQHQSESRRRRRGCGLMSANSSSDEFDEDLKPQRAAEPINGQPGASPNEEEEEEEEEV